MRLTVAFSKIGTYHAARLEAAARLLAQAGHELLVVQVSPTDQAHHLWQASDGVGTFQCSTLFPGQDYGDVQASRIQEATVAFLESTAPDVVAANGWAFPEARAMLRWAGTNRIPRVLMTTTWAGTARPGQMRAAVRRRLISAFQAALVGGTVHRDFLIRHGFPPERIYTGYNAVDVQLFSARAGDARANEGETRKELGLPVRYLLAVSRLVWEKDLPNVIRAMHILAGSGSCVPPLLIAGDGPLRTELERQVADLGLTDLVRFLGRVPYQDLPALYALSGGLVLYSKSETWGLVVNEAMSCGTPVLVSDRCGCVGDLVVHAQTGWVVPAGEPQKLAAALNELLTRPGMSGAMALRGRGAVNDFDVQRFARGLLEATGHAAAQPRSGLTPLVRRLARMSRGKS